MIDSGIQNPQLGELVGEDIESLKKELEEFKAKLSDATNSLQSLQREDSELDEQEKNLRKQLNELRAKRLPLGDKIKQARWDKRRVEEEVTNKTRIYNRAVEADKLNEEFVRLSGQLDDMARQFHWFTHILSHQLDGAKRLSIAKRALLGDKRGLGKTFTAIAWADLAEAKRVLIFCPKDVMRNFEEEIKTWAPHRPVTSIGGLSKIVRHAIILGLQHTPEFMVTCNYEAWRKDPELIQKLKDLKFDTVIVDEAHNIKETSTVAFDGIREIVYAENLGIKNPENFGDNCSVKNVLLMTGTPIINQPQDLYALLNLIDREDFGSKTKFLQDYCAQDWYSGKWSFRSGGLDHLVKKIGHRYLQRNRHEAGVVIPPQKIQYHDLDLDPGMYPEQFRVMSQLAEYNAVMLNDETIMNMTVALAVITRKRQAITWPAGIKMTDPVTGDVTSFVDAHESIKVDKAEELIEEFVMQEGERVVLFSQFKEPLKELQRRLEMVGIRVVRYDGDTSDATAREVQIDFDAKTCRANGREPKWDVILANYEKGGVGLNFTDASQMVILDEAWSPGKMDQAFGRIDRMGQTKETTVHVLRVTTISGESVKTVDTWMAQMIDRKAGMIEGFEDAHQDLAAELREAIRSGELM